MSESENINEHAEVQERDLEMNSPEVRATESFGLVYVRLYTAKWILKTRECTSFTTSALQ